jgi:hypothetical protein
MMMTGAKCSAFLGPECIASGPLTEIVAAVKAASDAHPVTPILVFDDETGRQVELDLRGSAAEVGERYRVLASVALRKLVDEARWTHAGRDRVRRAQDTAYRFMSTLAGNAPGFEEATRALYARDAARFGEQTAAWPRDVREYAQKLALDALSLHDAATEPG